MTKSEIKIWILSDERTIASGDSSTKFKGQHMYLVGQNLDTVP